MESWITLFTAHGKAKVQLSHVLQTELPTIPWYSQLYTLRTMPTTTESNSFFHRTRFAFTERDYRLEWRYGSLHRAQWKSWRNWLRKNLSGLCFCLLKIWSNSKLGHSGITVLSQFFYCFNYTSVLELICLQKSNI